MLRDLVTQARSSAIGASTSASVQLQLEAVTAERDFFRERYAAQIDEIEELKGQLTESQRVIDRLRSQILELEVERSPLVGHGTQISPTDTPESSRKNPKQAESSSSHTSLTSLMCEEDSTKSCAARLENATTCAAARRSAKDEVKYPANENNADSSELFQGFDTTSDSGTQLKDACVNETKLNNVTAEDDERSTDNESENGGDEESVREKDEADQIRANAERMLIWANYQTARRATPMKESQNRLENDECNVDGDSCSSSIIPSREDHVIQSLPASLNKTKSLLDDGSSLGSSSRNNREPSVGSWRSEMNSSGKKSGGGKLGKLLNSLRDMIDPHLQSDSEDENDDVSKSGTEDDSY